MQINHAHGVVKVELLGWIVWRGGAPVRSGVVLHCCKLDNSIYQVNKKGSMRDEEDGDKRVGSQAWMGRTAIG